MAIYVQQPSFVSLALLDWGVHILSLIILIRWLWSLSGSLASASAFRHREIICKEVNISITLIFKSSTVSPAAGHGTMTSCGREQSASRKWNSASLIVADFIKHQLCDKETDSNKYNVSCAVVFVHFFAHSYGWKRAGISGFNQIHFIRLEGLISLCWAPVGLIPCQLYTHQNSNKPFVVSFG